MPEPSAIPLTKALAITLGQFKQPIVTKYQLGIQIFTLYRLKSFQGIPLQLKKDSPELSDFNRYLRQLTDTGIIVPFPQFKGSVFSILGKDTESEWEIACSIDPFGYISHLSAMEYHGLTDRLPKMIFLSSPDPKNWKKFAQEKMLKDLGDNLSDYSNCNFPSLTRINFPKIGRQYVHRHSSIHYGAYKNVQGKMLRVSTIGRTFLDMIRSPDLCGGIYHVLDIYKEQSFNYLDLIVDEVERHGGPIDKVRVGYILDERCNFKHNTIDSWTKFVQRGGSRKLDNTQEYSSRYSPKWSISLNIEE